MVTKYVQVVPKNVSDTGGVCTSTYPTETSAFKIYHVASDVSETPFYDAEKDRRQIWVLVGDETEINNWITANSDMVTEKTFAEADAIGQELEPERAGKVLQPAELVDGTIPVFDLQTKLDILGI